MWLPQHKLLKRPKLEAHHLTMILLVTWVCCLQHYLAVQQTSQLNGHT